MRVNSPTESDEFFGLTTTTLAVLGGVLAIGYLVIRYRERAAAEREEAAAEREEFALERQRINQEFRLAIEQLGHDKPVVRIAGVYALVSISDQNGEEFKQRTVDVLCGYLRADRTNIDDRAVESTILQSIHERTGPQDHYKVRDAEKTPWNTCRFDFHGATFSEEVDFKLSFFANEVNFAGATFQQEARFAYSEFGESVDFSETTFCKKLGASWATFHKRATFTNAAFMDEAVFKNAKFHDDAAFIGGHFHKTPCFTEATFSFENLANISFPPSVKLSSDKLPVGAKFRETQG